MSRSVSLSPTLHHTKAAAATLPSQGSTPAPPPPVAAAAKPLPPSPSCLICDLPSDLILPCCGDFMCSSCVSKQVLSRSIDRYGGKRCALCRRELSATWTAAVTARAAMRRDRALQDRNQIIVSILQHPQPLRSSKITTTIPVSSTTTTIAQGARQGPGYCSLCQAHVTSLACHDVSYNHLRTELYAAKRKGKE